MKVRCLFSSALLLFACAKEQTPPPQAPGPDVVAIVLGHSITRSELGTQRLEDLVLHPLFERFRKENGITATELEIRGFMKANRIFAGEQPGETPREPKSQEDEAEERATAELDVFAWKVDRRMYELYGGDVIFQQSNPMEPVGAYRKFLEGEEKAGRFRILDPALAESFWAYFRREHRVVVEPSRVDYSLPWWAQMKKK